MTEQAPEVPEDQPWFLVGTDGQSLLRVTPALVVGETSAGALALNDPRPERRWITFTIGTDGSWWVELAAARGEMTGPAGELVPRYPLSHGLTLELPGNTLHVSRELDLPAADGPVLQVRPGAEAEEEVAAGAAHSGEPAEDQPEIVNFLNQLREQLGMTSPPPEEHAPVTEAVPAFELPLPERRSSATGAELPPRRMPEDDPLPEPEGPPPARYSDELAADRVPKPEPPFDPPQRRRPYRSRRRSSRLLDAVAVVGTLALAALATLLTVAPSGELAQRLGVDAWRPWAVATLQSFRGEDAEAPPPVEGDDAHALEPALARATSVLETSSAADRSRNPRPVPVMQPVATLAAPAPGANASGADSARAAANGADWRLLRARRLMAEGDISQPPGQNAVAMLTSLLADDPDNQAARALLEQCGARLIDTAMTYHDRGLEYEARNTLEEVLSFQPDDPEANRLWREWVGEGV